MGQEKLENNFNGKSKKKIDNTFPIFLQSCCPSPYTLSDRSVPNPFHIFPVKPFPDRLDVETNLDHRIVIQDLSPIKEERWFCHPAVYPFVIEAGELVPFCTDHHRMC